MILLYLIVIALGIVILYFAGIALLYTVCFLVIGVQLALGKTTIEELTEKAERAKLAKQAKQAERAKQAQQAEWAKLDKPAEQANQVGIQNLKSKGSFDLFDYPSPINWWLTF